jgi:hypothetical protein
MTRAEQLKGMAPQLIAEVTMYPSESGGRRSLAFPGWGCPCRLSKDTPIVARAVGRYWATSRWPPEIGGGWDSYFFPRSPLQFSKPPDRFFFGKAGS